MAGVLYCHTIAACHEVGDVVRMTRWTELAEKWLTTVPAEVTFGAMCAVHRAQLQLLRGAWDQAESGALLLVASLDANWVDYAAQAWYVVGEVRRLRGGAGAADAYGEAHARGYDPQPGRALLFGLPTDAPLSLRLRFASQGVDAVRRWVLGDGRSNCNGSRRKHEARQLQCGAAKATPYARPNRLTGLPFTPGRIRNSAPANGCSARSVSLRPIDAVVINNSSRSGPPNAHLVTCVAGIGITRSSRPSGE